MAEPEREEVLDNVTTLSETTLPRGAIKPSGNCPDSNDNLYISPMVQEGATGTEVAAKYSHLSHTAPVNHGVHAVAAEEDSSVYSYVRDRLD